MPTIGDFTAPGWSAPLAPGAGAEPAAAGGVGRSRCRAAAGALARDADAVVADRVFDLGQPGLVEQRGQRADQVGIGRQRRVGVRRTSPSAPRRAASSIRLGDRLERQLVALGPRPQITPRRREADIGMMAELSRRKMFDRCTSMIGSSAACSASSSATEVWVSAPALRMMPSAVSRASWIQSTSWPSWLVWRKSIAGRAPRRARGSAPRHRPACHGHRSRARARRAGSNWARSG